jgi:hypothetical protein
VRLTSSRYTYTTIPVFELDVVFYKLGIVCYSIPYCATPICLQKTNQLRPKTCRGRKQSGDKGKGRKISGKEKTIAVKNIEKTLSELNCKK